MKAEMLKIAGVKSEKEFYKKYPTEEAFMKAHKKEFKKAAMGSKMVNKQLKQLTDFSNPPEAQIGTYISNAAPTNQMVDYRDIFDRNDSMVTGSTQKERDYMAAMQQQQSGGGGGLADLAGLASQFIGKNGKKLAKAQGGTYVPGQGGPRTPSYLQPTGYIPGLGGQNLSIGTPQYQGLGSISNVNPQGTFNVGSMNVPNNFLSKGYSPNTGGKKGKGLSGILGNLGDIVGGIKGIKEEKKQRQSAERSAKLSGVLATASGTKGVDDDRRVWNRPEEFQPEQLYPSYGTGTNILSSAENGMQIGGNLTEIQNMYNPGDLYSNLGWEPLDESSNVKQYYGGGKLPKADAGSNMMGYAGMANNLWNMTGMGNAGGQLGGGIGGAIGSLGGPVFGALGRLAGNVLGSIFDTNADRIKRANETTQRNLDITSLQQGAAQFSQGRGKGFMEEGGWVSHDWQPQLITKFGDHTAQDVYDFAHEGMDTLRTGGQIRKNIMSPEDQFALGGELKTHWGGRAETASQNPYMPGTGESVEFKGNSHDTSDGKGRTGIGVSYGDTGNDSYTDYAEYGTAAATKKANVEVQGGEPGFTDSTGNFNVLGARHITNSLAKLIGDEEAAGKKFQTYGKELNKQESKQNKIKDKALSSLANSKDSSPFSLLEDSTHKANFIGADMKLQEIAKKKLNAAAVQNAINDTAEEFSHILGKKIDADHLMKRGDIKFEKGADNAKYGKSLSKAQKGFKSVKRVNRLLDEDSSDIDNFLKPIKPVPVVASPIKISKDDLDKSFQYQGALQSSGGGKDYKEKKGLSKKDLINVANQIIPYLRPTDQEPLDPTQLTGEMYALSTNQLEGVPVQLYHPQLDSTYNISLQDQLNEITAQARDAMRMAGGNPEAQGMIFAQAQAAKSKVLGEQMRINQAQQAQVFKTNRDLINDSTLKNLQILDQQYARQAEAKSKTKAIAQSALTSIADKIAKNKLENRTLGIYENLYNYRFDPSGRAVNFNPLATFNTEMGGGTASSSSKYSLPKGYQVYTSPDGEERVYKEKEDKAKYGKSIKATNGSIVKAIKSL